MHELNRMAATWAKAQSRLHNVWLFDLAERQKMRRQVESNLHSLGDDYDVGTYPAEPDIEINQRSTGGVSGILAAAGVSAAAALLAAHLLTAPAPPAPAPLFISGSPQAGADASGGERVVDVWVDADGLHHGVRKPEDKPLWGDE